MHDIHVIDLEFMGYSELIASFLVPCPEGGFVLLESGPASTLGALERGVGEAGFSLSNLRGVFLTHVHLDHGGGAGNLARQTGAAVYVHPEGVHHLVDPGDKLLPSAERLYGDLMIPLWGRVEGAPADQVEAIEDDQVVQVGGLDVQALHTPGHAVHHVAWYVDGAVATGDVAGVRFPGATHVLPPMPPPDIDVELWRASIARLRELAPERLLLTHFAAFDDVDRHLSELDGRLMRWLAVAEQAHAAGVGKKGMVEALIELDDAEMAEADVPPGAVERYRTLCPMDGNSSGLARYLKQRE